MDNKNIKKLAFYTFKQGKVDSELANAVFSLNRRDLISYLRFLKILVNKNSVTVISQTPIASSLKSSFVKRYPSKKVFFETADIGDGIRIVENDTIIDLTVSGMVDQTVEGLRSER